MKEHGVERWITPSKGDQSLGVDAESDKPTLVQSPPHLLESERAPRTVPRGQLDEALVDLELKVDRTAADAPADAQVSAHVDDAGSAAEEIANDEAWSPLPCYDDASHLGQVIDNRYVVEALIARGGMGIVYRCRHLLIDRKFAVKIIRGTMAHLPDALRRFLIEAKAASSIGNEHIVDVVDYGALPDGSTYLVMELLEGMPLSDIIGRQQTLPIERIARIAAQVCEGLRAAHEAGIVHRDLKPENVFLTTRKGTDFVKILDFGIAKMLSSGEPLTKKGLIVGTPHYMSPEQAAGATVDPRGDIYSLGVILYELATGQVPFDATHYMGVLAKHLTEPPPRFDSLSLPEKLPAEFEAIVQKCLAKLPDQRFQSMLEVMAATERLSERLSAVSPSAPPAPLVSVSPSVPSPWTAPPSAAPAPLAPPNREHRPWRSSSSSGGSVPAAAGRSVSAPPRTRGAWLVASALIVLTLIGVSLVRMHDTQELHGAGAPEAAVPLAPPPDSLDPRLASPAPAPSPPASSLPAPSPGQQLPGQELNAPLASATPPPNGAGLSPPAVDLAPAVAREHAADSPASLSTPMPVGPGTPVNSAEPLTVVELAPGKSVEIEARTRLSLRLTKDTQTSASAGPARRAPSPSRRSSAAQRTNTAKTERAPDPRPESGLMNPWPTPAIGPAKE
jgi:serine/threonine protein kinase